MASPDPPPSLPSQRASFDEEDPAQHKRPLTESAHQPGEHKVVQRDPLASAKSDFHAITGHDVSAVSVIPDSRQATQAKALAFARGSEVHVAPGQFKPDTSAGRKLLGHEFAHVVQQRQGIVRPTGVLSNGMKVNDDAGLERAADQVGDQLAQRLAAPLNQQTPGPSPMHRTTGTVIQREEIEDDEQDPEHTALGPADYEHAATNWADAGLDADGPFSAVRAQEMIAARAPDEGGDGAQLMNAPEPGQLFGGPSGLVVQLAFGPGNSGPKSYTTSSGDAVNNIMYVRTGAGYIDFTNPSADASHYTANYMHDNTQILDPTDDDYLNLLIRGAAVPLAGSRRGQHFKVANDQRGTGAGYRSPANYTWHHKDDKGEMVLVDRKVHRAHGHNGGMLIWGG